VPNDSEPQFVIVSNKDFCELKDLIIGKFWFCNFYLKAKKLIKIKFIFPTVFSGFRATCLQKLEKQAEELKDIKAYVQNLKLSSNGQPVSDYSSIPQLPLVDVTKLTEFETWLSLESNRLLSVSYV